MPLPLPLDPGRGGAGGLEACQALTEWNPLQGLAVITDPELSDEQPYIWIRDQVEPTLEDVQRLIPDLPQCVTPDNFPRYNALLLPLISEIHTWEAVVGRDYMTVLVWKDEGDTLACFTLNGKPSTDTEVARDYTIGLIERHLRR